jgi:C-terminal processing protease CtpA/Prc
LDTLKHRFRRFNSIPESKSSLWLLAAKFGPAMLSKSPIVLESEGMGPKKFHGRVVLLVDRHTASAAEMIVAFVRENKLGTILGEPTAGRLLSATSVRVGEGYRLALPTGAYYTWKGSILEGTPIEPDELVQFDWKERRGGNDAQLKRAIELLESGSLAQAS